MDAINTTINACRSLGTRLRGVLAIRREERWGAAVVLMAVASLQMLMTGKFGALLGHPTHAAWLRFMRNYRMSGYDPITYSVVIDWHTGYDQLRHPLLAYLMWPLSAIDRLAVWATGCDVAVWLVALLLTFCATYAFLFLYRTLREGVALGRGAAWLLTALFMGFGHVAVATVVADHFCLSMFMLMLTLWLSSVRLREGRRFTAAEAVALFALTSGITLSNGISVLLAVLVVNGRAALKPRFLFGAMALPAVAMLALGLWLSAPKTAAADAAASSVEQQMKWTRTDVSKADIAMENVMGESLQLHRSHVLGDVLSGRPVIVRYTSAWQYAVETLLVLLFAAGLALGLRHRLGVIVLAVFAYNMLLHLGLGFAADEVHITAAHWAMALPLSVGWVVKALAAQRRTRVALWAVAALLMAVTIYLWTYHGYLLHRYLTWPLCS